jgi:selenophosphate synthase
MKNSLSPDVKKLTDYADCAGCASKFQAAELDAILEGLPHAHLDDRVLVDFRTADDAGVYRWSDTSRRSWTTRTCSARSPPPTH